MSTMFLLYELPTGYSLFERLESEDIGRELEEVEATVGDLAKFGRFCKLKAFLPFKSAAHALENANDVSEGIVNETLKNFLEINLPKPGKKTKFILGVGDKQMATGIKQNLGYDCATGDVAGEMIRGIRLHADKLLKQFKEGDVARAQLGLGHAYSRAKVKFNVNRSDNMIIQSIALLDQLDKDVNTFAMRIREWYSWHFPELAKIVSDNGQYARVVRVIGDRAQVKEEECLEKVEAIVEDHDMAMRVMEAMKCSMGTDISPIDILNISHFADRVVSLVAYRKNLHTYLLSKMSVVAPNLAAVIGDIVGARLIAHAGSLTNLAKYPASTVQILGAEKALFRALKTKGNTPKYGLIFHSSFIGKAATKNKGRISRYLANKCSIASRLDCFSEIPSDKIGMALKQQVEDRLAFYENGVAPKKNADVMAAVLGDLKEAQAKVEKAEKSEKSSSKKRKATEEVVEEQEEEPVKAKKVKSDKKKSKKEGSEKKVKSSKSKKTKA